MALIYLGMRVEGCGLARGCGLWGYVQSYDFSVTWLWVISLLIVGRVLRNGSLPYRFRMPSKNLYNAFRHSRLTKQSVSGGGGKLQPLYAQDKRMRTNLQAHIGIFQEDTNLCRAHLRHP